MPHLLWTRLMIVGLIALATGDFTPAAAGEWPQILGPERNGIAANERIVESFPPSGPKTLWERKVGGGYAGLAVTKSLAVLYHRVAEQDVVEALDPGTGKTRWKQTFETSYATSFSDDDGPRCVPLIHEGKIYVYSAQGVLARLDAETGRIDWTRRTHQEFEAPEGYFGAGSTPLIEGKRIIVNVGGQKERAGIVAFDLDTGKTSWKATSEHASYSSPVAVTIGGRRQVLFVTRLKTVCLDPETGRVRFEFPFGKRGPTVNAASPVVFNDHLFVTAHYGVGARFVKLSADKAEILWSNDEILSSHYMTVIVHRGLLYGVHGQERVNEPELRCVDPKQEKVRWMKEGFGYGSLILADDKLIALTTGGELILVRTSAARYEELARARVFENSTRALPALCEGRLYARDSRTLKCIDMSRPPATK